MNRRRHQEQNNACSTGGTNSNRAITARAQPGSTETLQLCLEWLWGSQTQRLWLLRLAQQLPWAIRITPDQWFCCRIFCALTDSQDTKMIWSDLKCRGEFQRDLQRGDRVAVFPSRAKHCPGCFKELFHILTPLKKQKQKILEFLPFLQYPVITLQFLRRINRGN